VLGGSQQVFVEKNKELNKKAIVLTDNYSIFNFFGFEKFHRIILGVAIIQIQN